MDSQKKKLLEETYERIINVGLCIVPYEDLSDLAAPELMLFGTTKDEKVFSFNELDAMFKSQYEQMDGFMPSLDRKRLFTRISDDGNNAFITEEITLTIASDKVANYIYMRTSCVMEYIDNLWKLSHWHASTPVDTENDHWHLEEWKREKEKLQKLVDQQTADLKSKNRELEIEAAIERVRARTMAMKHSDELTEASEVLDQQVRALGIETWGCAFHIYADDPEGDYEWFSSREGSLPFYKTPREKFFLSFYEKGQAGETFHVEEFIGEDCKEHYDYLMTLPVIGDALEEIIDAGGSLPDSQYDHVAFFKHGYVLFITYEPVPEAHDVFKRFAKVFEQTYTRFLDLQRAEDQAREAQIEAALERVRGRSMGMHKSEELVEVVRQLKKEIMELGIDIDVTQIVIDFTDDPLDGLNDWVSVEGRRYLETFHIPFIEHPITTKFYETLNNDLGTFTAKYSKAEKNAYFKLLFKHSDFKDTPEERKNFILNAPGWVICGVILKNSSMKFARYNLKEFTIEEVEIFKRLGKVFGQAYTRFLDLQRAEEQARKAEIEAALERVRARSMVMHHSTELIEVVRLLDREIKGLGIQNVDATQIATDLSDPDEGVNIWIKVEEMNYLKKFHVPYIDHPVISNLFEEFKKKENFYTEKYSKAENNRLFKLLFKYSDFKSIPKERQSVLLNSPGLVRSSVILKNSALIFQHNGLDEFSEEDNAIFKRFGVVFEQAYTRFLDLQKAEEQAREAQIEAALERVRSRTMAMQHSEDLSETSAEMFRQIQELGLEQWSCGFNIFDHENNTITQWVSSGDGRMIPPFETPSNEDVFRTITEAFKEDESFISIEMSGEELKAHYDYMSSLPVVGEQIAALKEAGIEVPNHQVLNIAFFKHGYLLFITFEQVPEYHQIYKRFADVFKQTYTRFLDLKKAEKQAREAKIESALEKIRSRTMGMQSSEELPEVANLMFLEVQALGIPAWSCGYCILLDDGKSSTCIMSSEGTLQKPFMLPHSGEASFIEWDDFVQSEETFFTQELGGKAIESHYNFMKSLPQLTPIFRELEEAGLSLPTYQINHLCKISHGFLLFITYEPVPDAHDIFKRFTNVFEQTYTRFLDLKKAEKLALETARQSSLDRIRAEIGSMRSAGDLNQITPIIWDELKTLDIPFIRCGVFIIDEENGISHTYLSTSQGEPIAALHLPIEGISLVENAVEAWRKRKIYTEHWDKQDFRDWSQNLIDRGFIDSKKKYEAGSAPETLDLHFLPFKHGMLYIGNTESLSQEKLDLGQSMAKAFSVAYDRYEDFNKLEQAKQKIEEAFRELEAAKDQLVQQEKLASLGQLTAGIAHEIKNPLNFVNNFSDLSIELVEEVREEVKTQKAKVKRNIPSPGGEGQGEGEQGSETDLILDILNDIEANLRKIHEHGTRADGIVKSMLQHSRGGEGKMEPTDVNALIKEYANLAFHGMRAGKEPINVDIDLNLDETVGEVPLVAEDFSRVILNICNNAFDAMREKDLSPNPSPAGEGRRGEGEYSPKLTVRTKKKDEAITIEIQDNGPGIPDDIKDKILQPFFTTKKGTAGTGLGLSITNDIIKAHGGDLSIDTNQGKGTTFIISLR